MKKLNMFSFDLGSHSMPVSTDLPKAQKLFDMGLNWCFGFNQEAGLECFEEGLLIDPTCAMLHWGAAYAAGPFYNMPWGDFSAAEARECTAFCRRHIDKALALSSLDNKNTTSRLEAALIHALSMRIQRPVPVTQAEFDSWDDAYANAMRKINQRFANNIDVMALFVEAMMTRTPWRLWDADTNLPSAGADTLEAIDVCKAAIALADARDIEQHPAILHLYIHLLEMSPEPERAMEAADRLRGLCPDAGHIHHMPGHIYVLCGEYEKAKIASEKAIAVDRKYLAYAGPYNYYTTARCHDLHLMIFTCMMLGQFKPALLAAEEICQNLSPDVINLEGKPFIASTMEGYYAMKMHVLVRFGKWQDIIDTKLPDDPVLYCVTMSMHHYARGVAFAALHRFDEAQRETELFYGSLQRIPPGRKFFNNEALQTLGVGEKMLLGERAYHTGAHEAGFALLREAVTRYDNLHYSEPWPWMHPPRHALGALLLEQGQFDEAESVFRADLGLTGEAYRCTQHPRNIWALHGYVECLQHRGKPATAELAIMQAQLAAAQKLADQAINASCACRYRAK